MDSFYLKKVLFRPVDFLSNHLFHPPVGMERQRYVRSAILAVTLISLGISVTITIAIQFLTHQPDYLIGMVVAVSVPLLVVPPLAYRHHDVLFELESSRRKIETLSRTDELTGLLNRRHFFEMVTYHMALATRHGHPISLLLIDLDFFKSVNDRFGHQAGDEVLKQTAASLNRTKRCTDILARYGGEEFALLMPNTEGVEAMTLCRRLHHVLADDQASRGSQIPPITMSIGVACSSRHGYHFDRLLSKADQALYEAKAKGRNTSVFSGGRIRDPNP